MSIKIKGRQAFPAYNSDQSSYLGPSKAGLLKCIQSYWHLF